MLRNGIRNLLLATLLCVPVVAVQTTQDVFRSESDLVVLHVTVFNGRAEAVPDLSQDAFSVLEDNTPQDITFFTSGNVPVAVGLVLDNSGSMIARQGMLIAGGGAFARSSHPGDELFTIHFNERVAFGLPGGLAFTDRESLLTAALARFRAGGRTALHDAVMAGLDHLESASHQKRVLVVLSDGEDNASAHSEDEMIERARNSNAIVYTVSNGNGRAGLGGNARLLRKLAGVAGGIAYFPDTDRKVVETLDQVAASIRRGYLIGYAPSNTLHDGTYRSVKVIVHTPGQKNLRVRSRDGYRAHNHPDGR
jgi:Ca-activated chloride channel homolog